MDWSQESLELSTTLAKISTRMNMILSLLLGFLGYSFFSALPFDYYLLKSLFKKRPSFFMVLNRIAYFTQKYVGVTYFVIAIIIIQRANTINCASATSFHQAAFYILIVTGHWLFVSRMLAIWRTHSKFLFIFAYTMFGVTALIVLCVLSFKTAKLGTVVEPYGCIYIENDQTLPNKVVSLTLALTSSLFHTFNTVLASLRLATMADVEGGGLSLKSSVRSLMEQMSSKGRAEAANQPYTVLKQNLMVQDLGHYILRLISLICFILVPTFGLRQYPLLLMAGYSLYIAVDVEIGGRIFRATIIAIQQPKAQLSDSSHPSNFVHSTTHHYPQPYPSNQMSNLTPTLYSSRLAKGDYRGSPSITSPSIFTTDPPREGPATDFFPLTPSSFAGRRSLSLRLPPIVVVSSNHTGRRNVDNDC